MRKKSSGFTLIELLVVIAILAILAAISISVFGSAQKNTRDGVRKYDLNIIQNYLEQYRSDQGFYPSNANTSNCIHPNADATTCGLINTAGLSLTNATGNPSSPTVSKTYATALPIDPKNLSSTCVDNQLCYQYSYVPSPVGCNNSNLFCTGYCLFGSVENTGNTSTSENCPESSMFNYSLAPQ